MPFGQPVLDTITTQPSRTTKLGCVVIERERQTDRDRDRQRQTEWTEWTTMTTAKGNLLGCWIPTHGMTPPRAFRRNCQLNWTAIGYSTLLYVIMKFGFASFSHNYATTPPPPLPQHTHIINGRNISLTHWDDPPIPPPPPHTHTP